MPSERGRVAIGFTMVSRFWMGPKSGPQFLVMCLSFGQVFLGGELGRWLALGVIAVSEVELQWVWASIHVC